MAVGLGPQPPMWSFRSRILCIFFRLFRRHRLYIERRSNFCCQLCCEKPLLTQQHRLQIVWHYPTPGRFRKTILMFHILDDMTARSLLEFNVVPTCLNSQLNHGDPKLLNREVGDTFSGVHCLNMGVSQSWGFKNIHKILLHDYSKCTEEFLGCGRWNNLGWHTMWPIRQSFFFLVFTQVSPE